VGTETPVVMGRVLGAYGVKGWIRIHPHTEAPDGLARFKEWWIQSRSGWKTVRVAEWARHGAQLVARLEGCESREQAAELRGSDVGVMREAFPAPAEGEVYQADVLGLRVVNRQGEELGRVEELMDNGAHVVLRVRHAEGERLLPYVAGVIDRVDVAAGVVTVDWGADW
jgi:16S rRNA processing protein RimM